MNIDIIEGIEAAATKWNFNVYYPGAGVDGHCLPVDPYYLVTKAEELGYHSKVITAGRALNDYMPLHVFDQSCASGGRTHVYSADIRGFVKMAEELGYHSKVITAGSAVNDYMPLRVFGLLGSGVDFGVRFTYEIQDEAGGITKELGLAEGFADEEDGAAILGMKKRKIDEKFDKIVQFAEIEQFLDTPVKRYSSGMYVRLAFAVGDAA